MKKIVFLALCLAVILPAILVGSAEAAERPTKTLVVLPVQVDSEFYSINQEMAYLSERAFKEMGDFEIFSEDETARAIRKTDLYLDGSRNRRIVLDDTPRRPMASMKVLDKDVLLEVGQNLDADYAAGVYFKCWNKTTNKFLTGKVDNGRTIAYLTVVDVRSGKVLYDAETPEIGEADQNKVAAPLIIAGALLGTGIVGSGHRARELGWLAMATPQFVKSSSNSKEELQYRSGLKAAKKIFNDFVDRWDYRRRSDE